MEHSSTTPPEKAGTQCTTTNHYPHWVHIPITTGYHHGNHNKTSTRESHTHKPQLVAKHESERNDATTRDRLLVHDANIQLGQHNTRTTSQSCSHGHKVQLPLHNHKSKNNGDQRTPQPAGHTPHRPMPDTFRDSGSSSLK
ncbi:hypothetical protein Taro_054977 [Colocasia esculenta]|uniref:Uncharacterized protein n=1 Tax=Colocasia esculenta TaxID=4460 RepID=A0A843XS98_COLES|nr:hypothetical protein [Colocasia esculenta]